MKTPSSIFRPSLAWLLLLIVCSQHLAGRLYVGRVYSVEIAARMTPNEHAVATMLKAKTGIDIQVTLLGENQPHHISRTGYTAPVVISEEIDGTTYFYAIGHKPEKTAYFTYPANTQQAADTYCVQSQFPEIDLEAIHTFSSILNQVTPANHYLPAFEKASGIHP